MKKVLALLLAFVMVFALVACGEGSTETDTGTPAAETTPSASSDTTENKTAEGADVGGTVGSTKAYPNCNEDGSINLDRIAHFDSEYDYTQNEAFKVVYLSADIGPLYTEFDEVLQHWSKMFNVDYVGFFCTYNDTDLFMTSLQNYVDQGVKGFILEPDSESFPIIAKFFEDYPDCAWCGRMAGPRDCEVGDGIPEGGNLINWYVGFDHYDAGYQCALKLVDWKNEVYPDVSVDEVGILCFDFSVSNQLHERVAGVYDVFEAAGYNMMDNFFVVDCVATGLTMQGGIEACSPVVATHGEFKYWLAACSVDDWAQAAASVFDQQGLTDNACCVAFGGAGLKTQWDAGQFDSFRYALYSANALYAEPVLGAIYAELNGWCTSETIWPSWVNWNDCGGEGHSFAQLRLPAEWLEPDSYQHYLAWCDLYCQSNVYGYEWDGLDIGDYSPFVEEIPASYAKQ